MRITSVTIQGFGSVSGTILTLGPGLQVYFGANEAGKTTLVSAIAAGLYGWDARRRRDRELAARYRPWGGGSYGLAVELEWEGTLYRIVRDFNGLTAEAYASSGGQWRPCTPAAALEAAIGIQDDSLFRSLLVFSQTEVGELDRRRVGEALASKLAGAGDDVSAVKAVDLLRRRLLEVSRKGQTTRTEGELQTVTARVRELTDRLARTASACSDLLARKAEVESLQAESEEAERRLASLVPILERWSQAHQAKERLGDAQAQQLVAEAKLRSLAQLKSRLDHLGTVLEMYSARTDQFTDPAREALEDSERLWSQAMSVLEERGRARNRIERELERSRRQLTNASLSLESISPERYSDEKALEVEAASSRALDADYQCDELGARLQAARSAGRGLRVRSARCFISSIAVAAGALVVWAAAPSLGWLPLVLGGLLSVGLMGLSAYSHLGERSEAALTRGLVVERRRFEGAAREACGVAEALLEGDTLADYRENRRRMRALTDLRLASEQAVAAQEYSLESVDVSSAETVVRAAEERFQGLLSAAGCASLDEYRRQWSRCLAAQGERTHLEREMALVLDGRAEAEWEAIALSAAGAIRLESTDSRGLASELLPEDVVRVQVEIPTLQETKRATLAALERARGRMEQLQEATREDAWTLNAELDEAVRRADDLEIEQLALKEAIACMEAAMTEVQGSLVPEVCARAGDLLTAITDGRYQELMMVPEGKDVVVTVKEPRLGRWVEPEALSTGTRDQIYIALRIALAEHLTGREFLTFILDDPFVHFDEDRLGCTIRALCALGRHHQVVWFVKDRSLAERCRAFCPVTDI